MADTPYEIEDVKAIKETEKALLCEIEGEEVWIPKSQIMSDSEVFDEDENSKGTLVITEWIAMEKELI